MMRRMKGPSILRSEVMVIPRIFIASTLIVPTIIAATLMPSLPLRDTIISLGFNQWRRPGAEFGENGNLFRGARFQNDVFFEKNYHFRVLKFSWPFFVGIDQVFLIFPFFFQILRIFTVLNVVYQSPFLNKNNHYFRKEFLGDTFFYSVRTFARIQQHYFSKYWGDRCTSNLLGGPSPQPPLGPRLWF